MIASNSPEDARLAACGPRDVTLYSRPGCHLCEEAKAAIGPLLREFGAILREVNIDETRFLKSAMTGTSPLFSTANTRPQSHPSTISRFLGNCRKPPPSAMPLFEVPQTLHP